jgi:predicted membrane protein
MEIILFSLISALSILLVLTRTLGLHRTLKIRKILDVIITFGIPILFAGTFSGMITAFFTGLWFTLLTCLLYAVVNPPQMLVNTSTYGKQQDNKSSSESNRPSRSRRSKVCPH